jgi:hypothetical protein
MSENYSDPVNPQSPPGGAPAAGQASSSGHGPPPGPSASQPSGQAYQQAPPAAGQAPGGWHDSRGRWHERAASAFETRRKSPGLASVLSLAPGLGQVYLGYYARGFTHLAIVAFVISLLAEGGIPDFMYPLLGLFLPFFWLYNIIDAGRRAAYCNMVLEGGSEGLPPEFDVPQRGGSMAGGVALIIGGLAMLLHLQFDWSLIWLETWWPILPVGIGIYLFLKGLRERAEST